MSIQFESLCPGCFEEKGRTSICPHCGYDESLDRGPLALPHRTLLQGQYLIGRVLGRPGGFGITYLALDTGLETRVAIKEYLPRDLAGRDGTRPTVKAHSREDGELFRFGLEQFLREARTLAKFDHLHLVRIRHVFEANGTAYLVMDYYEGVTLAEYLHQKGRLPEKTALDILMPILDGLREVHEKGFIHRDIKPQNIYITTSGRAILLDFGAARLAMTERSRSLSVVLTPGYAPFEQYHRKGEQGPWTDVYACAAVLYEMVTGEAPPEATERVSDDSLVSPNRLAPTLSFHVSEGIQRGLAIDFRNRPKTMQEFQHQLLDEQIITSPHDRINAIESAKRRSSNPRKLTASSWAIGAGGVFLGGVLVFLVSRHQVESSVPENPENPPVERPILPVISAPPTPARVPTISEPIVPVQVQPAVSPPSQPFIPPVIPAPLPASQESPVSQPIKPVQTPPSEQQLRDAARELLLVLFDSSVDIDTKLKFYKDRVNYFDKGFVNKDFLYDENVNYENKWPNRDYSLDGIDISSYSDYSQSPTVTVKYRYNYKVRNSEEIRRGESEGIMVIENIILAPRISSVNQTVISKTVEPIISPSNTATQIAFANSPGDGYLALRSAPNAQTGERILKIPHGASVRILECPDAKAKGDYHWCYVNFNNQLGWVFDKYLIYGQ